eukprot:scaffold4481_cov121-Cylindrotheca_fusiformis.AAC.17
MDFHDCLRFRALTTEVRAKTKSSIKRTQKHLPASSDISPKMPKRKEIPEWISRAQKKTVGQVSDELTADLDPIQKRAVDAALLGKNLFLTGVAGTGKSLVTQRIVKAFKERGKEVAIAAPTGVAAVNLNLDAQTVHSLAGIRVPARARDFAPMLNRVQAKKWRKLEVVVIDEVGMLTADFLDWLDVHVRRIRNAPLEVFGGIQLIFVGDFCQLGPIKGSVSLKKAKAYAPNDSGADCFLNIQECTAFAFQSALWREAKFISVHLRKVYRQQSDQEFIKALQDLRESKPMSKRVQDLVQHCRTPLADRVNIPEGIRPTVLYCTNQKVDSENRSALQSLNTGTPKVFEAIDSIQVDSEVPTAAKDMVEGNLKRNKFFEQCQATRKLELKVGAQVMLLQNNSKTLVNGSRGVVVKMHLCPVVRDTNKQTEERLIGPEERDKFPGRRYDELKFGMKLEFDKRSWTIFKFVKYPVVKFLQEERIIMPSEFKRTLYRQGTCVRQQLPLRLAWAMTVHKSQGSTLDLVLCDLRGCFTSGQSYVALSRARSMEGLEIRNFDAKHVRSDPLVDSFYRALDEGSEDEFLETEAGLWWYPLLESPEWFSMFHDANNSFAKKNSAQFRQWVQDYQPPANYKGWKGYII